MANYVKLYSRLILGDLRQLQDARGFVEASLSTSLRALESEGEVDWDTLVVRIGPDDNLPEATSISAVAYGEQKP